LGARGGSCSIKIGEQLVGDLKELEPGGARQADVDERGGDLVCQKRWQPLDAVGDDVLELGRRPDGLGRVVSAVRAVAEAVRVERDDQILVQAGVVAVFVEKAKAEHTLEQLELVLKLGVTGQRRERGLGPAVAEGGVAGGHLGEK